ncbi:Chromosome III, complete sequence, related, partial [Eimeria tenella]
MGDSVAELPRAAANGDYDLEQQQQQLQQQQETEQLQQQAEQLLQQIKRDPWKAAYYEAALRIREVQRAYAEHCPIDEELLLQWFDAERRQSSSSSNNSSNSSLCSIPRSSTGSSTPTTPSAGSQPGHSSSSSSSSSSVDEAKALLELGLRLQPSVSLWLQYIRHLEGAAAAAAAADREWQVRFAFENALCTFQLHALEGPCLWGAYRHFEAQLLRHWQSSSSSSSRQQQQQQQQQVQLQIARIRTLFYRQLQLPLGGLGDLLDEYRVWELEHTGSEAAFSVGASLHAAAAAEWSRSRKAFEMKVQNALEEDQANRQIHSIARVWGEYLDSEKQIGDTARVLVTYHRALEELGALRPELWRECADYIA